MTDTTKDVLKSAFEITVVLLSVVTPYIVLKIKAYYKKKKELLFVNSHKNQWSREVFQKIVELRLLTYSNRSWVCLRSNGTAYYNGQMGDHLTMVYESVDNSTKSIFTLMQKIPMHFFEDTYQICDEQGFVSIKMSDLNDGFFKADMESKGDHWVLIVPIRKNARSIPEGYLGISYVRPMEVEMSINRLQENLVDYSGQIGLILRIDEK